MGSIDYANLGNVKTTLGIPAADTTRDTIISRMITEVSRAIDTYVFGPNEIGFQSLTETPEELIEFHDGGWESIILRRLFTELAAKRDLIEIEEDGVVLTLNVDYQFDAFPANTIYRISALDTFGVRFAAGRRNVKVTYNPAYELVPQDINRVATEETARAFLVGNSASTDGGSLVVTQRTPDTGSTITYRPDDFSPMSLRVLDGYRKRLSFV